MTGPQNVLRDLPESSADRKQIPITTGVLDYFPLALAEVARISKAGNDQHNPGQPMHWARNKSSDHADCITRHLIQRGSIDSDGMRHSAKLAWRALALLQEELEAEAGFVPEKNLQREEVLRQGGEYHNHAPGKPCNSLCRDKDGFCLCGRCGIDHH